MPTSRRRAEFGSYLTVTLALALLALLRPAQGAVSVSSSDIALYGDTSGHNVGLYTAASYSPPNASLTYPGSPSPAGTSHVVVNVDGTPYGYDAAAGGALAASGSGLGAALSGSKAIGPVQVSVRYEIVSNPQTGVQPDTMRAQFSITNTDAVAHQVGLRYQIDTDVNGVDGANISANNGFSVVSTGTVFRVSNGNMPGNWWDYDIPPPPANAANLVGRGSVFGNPYGVPATQPDALEIVNWGSVSTATQWTLGSIGSMIGDSAVVYWWTGTGSETGLGITLAPGASRTFTAYYGIDRGVLLSTFTPTPVPGTPTFTPTITPSATPTATPTATPSSTATPSFTITQTHTHTPSFTVSPTVTPTSTASPTFTATPPPLLLTPKHPNPNPASETMWLPFMLSVEAEVDIRVYSIAGELVRSFDPLPRKRGTHEQAWDLRNQAGNRVASGVYLYRIRALSEAGESDDAWMKCAVAR